MRRVVLSSVATPALQFISTLSHKQHGFSGGGGLLNIKCVLIFSANWSEKFFILKKIQRDVIIRRSSSEVQVILVTFSWNLTFLSADFRKILKYKISYSPSMELFHVDGRADGKT